jgi:hypothetical protein
MRKEGKAQKRSRKKKSKQITIRVNPSQKEILKQEKERCKTTMSEIIRQHAFEEIEPQGGSIVTPIIYRSVTRISENVYDKASEIGKRELTYELQDLESEMNMRAATVRETKERREELWEKARQETESTYVRVRINPKRFKWLQGYTSENAPSTLLREKGLKGLQKREKMGRMETLFVRWARKAQTLSEWDPGYREEELREEMQKLGKEMYRRVKEVCSRVGEEVPQ